MKSKFFVPQPDITPYELAVIWATVVLVEQDRMLPAYKAEIKVWEADWEAMPLGIKRHFADAPATLSGLQGRV
jgi:hypothetical protein